MLDEVREELIEIFEYLKPQVTDCLFNQVLPASITHNGRKAGITIQFRQLRPSTRDTLIIERDKQTLLIDDLQIQVESAEEANNDADKIYSLKKLYALKEEAEAGLKDIDAKLEKINPEEAISEQALALIQKFPIGTQVRTKDDGTPGNVAGYRNGAKIGRTDELALIVMVPGDKWILYANQVDKIEEE